MLCVIAIVWDSRERDGCLSLSLSLLCVCVLPCQLAQSHHFFVWYIPNADLKKKKHCFIYSAWNNSHCSLATQTFLTLCQRLIENKQFDTMRLSFILSICPLSIATRSLPKTLINTKISLKYLVSLSITSSGVHIQWRHLRHSRGYARFLKKS